METLWFCLVAFMLTMYVVFDGFDLGAGAVHLFVAKSDPERRLVLRSIGPVWDANEVWLLASGGALYLAFPSLYATSFSGFYLPLMVVLWLLILRAISLEFRNHVNSPAWIPLWDVVFSIASLLLAVFFGAALGNVVRGVPLDETGRFFSPLWTDFRPASGGGILDPYTILVGVSALAALVLHGGAWIAVKTNGLLQARARRVVSTCWWAVAALTVILTAVTLRLQPQVWRSLTERPWGWIFPLVAVAGLVLVLWLSPREKDVAAFLASCLYLVGMLTSAAFGLYPFVLPASTDPARGLTVLGVAAPRHALGVALAWWLPGILLVAAYFTFAYRHFAGKVSLEEEGY